MDSIRIFKPRSSRGWLWLLGLALIVIVIGLLPIASVARSPALGAPVLLLLICLAFGGVFIGLATLFPTMRYELDETMLTLRYGLVLRYRIPLDDIRSMRRRNLALSIGSSVRLPGLALFNGPCPGVGNVKMCATACSRDILLIETAHARYGVTPADEQAFVQAVQARIDA